VTFGSYDLTFSPGKILGKVFFAHCMVPVMRTVFCWLTFSYKKLQIEFFDSELSFPEAVMVPNLVIVAGPPVKKPGEIDEQFITWSRVRRNREKIHTSQSPGERPGRRKNLSLWFLKILQREEKQGRERAN